MEWNWEGVYPPPPHSSHQAGPKKTIMTECTQESGHRQSIKLGRKYHHDWMYARKWPSPVCVLSSLWSTPTYETNPKRSFKLYFASQNVNLFYSIKEALKYGRALKLLFSVFIGDESSIFPFSVGVCEVGRAEVPGGLVPLPPAAPLEDYWSAPLLLLRRSRCRSTGTGSTRRSNSSHPV